MFILFGLCSCRTSTNTKNAPEDIKYAENLAQDFYTNLSQNDTVKIYETLDSSINDPGFRKLLKDKERKIGAFYRIDINQIETNDIQTDDEKYKEYTIELTVHYDKVKNIETLGFRKEESKKALLYSYYFKSIR